MAATFGDDPPRWFSEPQMSAVTLYSAFQVAYQGCQTLTSTDVAFADAPTADTANAQCAEWANRFWNRTASADEVAACVQVATQDTQSVSGARLRWAYTCASLLTSAGFLSY
jgi:hypothetical protein